MQRFDPDYLTYLEDQVEGLKELKQPSSDISFIIQHLEALELAQQQHQTPILQHGLQGATGHQAGLHAAGGTGSTAVRTPAGQETVGVVSGSGAGIGEGSGGIHDPPVDPSLLPLADVLAQLTQAVDPAAGKAKGLFLRPEYYAQYVKSSTPLKQLDHNKLSYCYLVHGWFCVLQHLIAKGGDVGGYAGHCKFVAEQATSCSFVDAAFVNYDHHVVGKVVDGLSTTFTAGDMLGVASHLNAANLVVNKPPTSAKKPRKNRFFPHKSTADHKDKQLRQYFLCTYIYTYI